ncbi:Uncharacterised protein [Corynebacterium imitans]|uniref:Uncharacterized protein n=1 Tax=Corynebacterium imitans TaxID=156978 RepID=A0A240A3F3_9CORY|nr:hypothetical protein [Corynebacterium imitans]SNV77660.1 Uncharacterised protein [Corynebacterium imitans]
MEQHTFNDLVEAFASEIEELLDSTLAGETHLERLPTNAEKRRATFNASKVLHINHSGSKRLHLRCVFRLCTDSTGEYLAVEGSTFKVEFKALSRFVPIVRFEYDRSAWNKPASHFQFHADSVALGLLLARAGKYDTAAQQQDIHFPMGGHRFRVCLEDVIELLIREFGAEPLAGWEERVQSGRDTFYKAQTETVIMRNLPTAVDLLRQQGFEIRKP